MGHAVVDAAAVGGFWIAIAGDDVALLLVCRWTAEIGLELSVVADDLDNVNFEL